MLRGPLFAANKIYANIDPHHFEPAATQAQPRQVATPTSALDIAQLTFKPSPVVRKKVIDEFVKGLKALKPEVGV
jgi:hypothetical protein